MFVVAGPLCSSLDPVAPDDRHGGGFQLAVLQEELPGKRQRVAWSHAYHFPRLIS
jgi:hypothetical protein